MTAADSLLITRAEGLAERFRIRMEQHDTPVEALLDALSDSKLTLTHDPNQTAREAYWAYQGR